MQARAPVHGFEQLPVLLLAHDVHARGEQAARARHALGELELAARGGLAGLHRRREPPGHELVDRLQALHPVLAQVGDAAPHDVVVGARGAKAALVGGDEVLDLRGKPRQLLQELRLVGAALLGDVGDDRGEPPFLAGEGGHRRARRGQREQRHHAVGLDLEEALQHAPGAAARQRAIEHDEAAEAVVVDAEVGQHRSGAVADLRADEVVAREQRRVIAGVGRSRAAAHQLGVPGEHELARQRRRPALGQRGERGGGKRRGIVPWRVHGVGRELGVPLPADAAGAELGAEVARIGRRSGHPEARAEVRHAREILRPRLGRRHQGEVARAQRRLMRLVGARVHLVREVETLRMVGGRCGLDGHGCHSIVALHLAIVVRIGK